MKDTIRCPTDSYRWQGQTAPPENHLVGPGTDTEMSPIDQGAEPLQKTSPIWSQSLATRVDFL